MSLTEENYKEDLLSWSHRSFDEWKKFIDTHEYVNDADTFSIQRIDFSHLEFSDMLKMYDNELMVAYAYVQSLHRVLPNKESALRSVYYNAIRDMNIKTILDHGCGNFDTAFSGHVLGYDMSVCDLPTSFFNFMIYRLKKRSIKIKFYPVEDHIGYLGDEQFDYIISHMTAEHIMKPDIVISYLVQHINPGGYAWLQPDFTVPGGHHLKEGFELFGYENGEKILLGNKRWHTLLSDLGLKKERDFLYVKR